MSTAFPEIQVKEDLREHVLARPDTYLGNFVTDKYNVSIVNGNKIVQETVVYNPAFERAVIEVGSNCVDNVWRSSQFGQKCTAIRFEHFSDGSLSFWNDGLTIPIQQSKIPKLKDMYNPSIVFGVFMSSTNYNDEEKRRSSGRNGYGSKLCLADGTKIPLWSGGFKEVQDILIGETLIGDDGSKRTVMEKTKGYGKLFQISQDRGLPYIVNENHILTLMMTEHKRIVYVSSRDKWRIQWFDQSQYKIENEYFSSCEEAEIFAKTLSNTNRFDIPLKIYLSMNKTTRDKLVGFTSDCVQWEEKEVPLDPYILGLWLGDGFSSEYAFDINGKDDSEILTYLTNWGKTNDTEFIQESNIVWRIQSSSSSRCDVAPLKKFLDILKVANKKHIPELYLHNSRDIRLKLLAGIIDSNGTVTHNRSRVSITQSSVHAELSQQITYLARSLGFLVGQKKQGSTVKINISGPGMSYIPTILSRNHFSDRVDKYPSTGKLCIKEVESGNYTGLRVDGNHRFALEDFTVTHNCNTFAKSFTVETQDETRNLHFIQTWRENMSVVEPAIVTKRAGKGFTKVTWLPDYSRFKMSGLTEPVIGLIRKYLYDIAMLTKVPVYFNGTLIPVRSLSDYAQSFRDTPTDEIIYIQDDNSEVVVVPSKVPLTVAFTNGIPNPDGGVHVDTWSKAIFSSLTAKLNPDEGPKLTLAEVRAYFSIFVSCSLDNPSFTSQEKSKLTAPKPNAVFKVGYLNKMMKWSVISKIKDHLESKQLRAQKKKLEGAKRVHPNVKKLEDANLAGTVQGRECILIYCEGDSAKTFAVAGIERGVGEGATLKQGRDYFGILPCGGKILNVRNADAEKISENEGIQMLIQTLGLEIGMDYTVDSNYHRLRYGSLMIITDADDDGIHIEGLCHNFFHKLFPTLMKRSPPFITSMKTPLVRVSLKGGEEKKFYRQQAFKDFQETSSHLFSGKPRHFKGLGTNDDSEVIDCFGQRIVHYVDDDKVDDQMVKAFGKKKTDARKEWISSYDPEGVLVLEDENAINVQSTCSDFIDTELIIFSIANCARSLPHLMDGLKESQRKIIYTILKQKLTYEKKGKKVYRLSGEVASMTEYIHGEQCLWDTITGMAWDFVGSNNVPLLVPEGQFGSRLSMGKDASNARYIFTRQQEIIPYLFREEDLPIMDYIQGEDMTIEPMYYVPVVPLILLNGVRGGIGTGFSSKVPAYNPMDVLECLRVWIRDNLESIENIDNVVLSELPEISPWYQGFTGSINKVKGKYISIGVVNRINETTSEIIELPIGMSTDKFRAKLVALREAGKIVDFKDYCSKTRVHFIVKENKEGMSCTVKSLGLTSSLPTTNMVAFNPEGKIHRYDTIDEIIYDFAQTRLKWYQKRKDYIVNELKNQLVISTAKRRFVEEIINKQIEVYRKKKTEIVSILEERNYPLHENKYEYLLKLPIDSFTEDMIHKLDGVIDKLSFELKSTEDTSTRQMWSKELDEFEAAYKRYQKRWASNEAMLNCGKDRNTRKVEDKKISKRKVRK